MQKLNQFYDEIKSKRKKKQCGFQVDNELHQVKIKDLNDKCSVEMFTKAIRGGKAFVVEQKIRELKCRIAKLRALKMKVPPTTIILQYAENMNDTKTKMYDASSIETEQKSLSSEKFTTLFYFSQDRAL